jgi:hypothetical protein
VKSSKLDKYTHGSEQNMLSQEALESIEEVSVLFEKVKSYRKADASLSLEYQEYLQEVCLNLKKTLGLENAP